MTGPQALKWTEGGCIRTWSGSERGCGGWDRAAQGGASFGQVGPGQVLSPSPGEMSPVVTAKSTCPSAGDQLNKSPSSSPAEYYAAAKKGGALSGLIGSDLQAVLCKRRKQVPNRVQGTRLIT